MDGRFFPENSEKTWIWVLPPILIGALHFMYPIGFFRAKFGGEKAEFSIFVLHVR